MDENNLKKAVLSDEELEKVNGGYFSSYLDEEDCEQLLSYYSGDEIERARGIYDEMRHDPEHKYRVSDFMDKAGIPSCFDR